MLLHDALVARVEADIVSAEGPFHVNGVYYAAGADVVRRRLAVRTADQVARVRAWARRGAPIGATAVLPTLGRPTQPFERCIWCGFGFAPNTPTVMLAGRPMHDGPCRAELGRVLAENEKDLATVALRLAVAS